MIKKRKQELKHAQDVKELYQKKLDRVHDLFMELETWKLQLEEQQRTLNRKEKQLNIQSSKVYYKKKLKPSGMFSNKMSISTIFGHKHFKQKFKDHFLLV